MTLQEIFDLPYFHGRLTDEEAYNLCQEELASTGKSMVYIWHLSEIDGELHGIIKGYHRGSKEIYNGVAFPYPSDIPLFMPFNANLRIKNFVERRNPHQLQELARVAILDSLDYCCLKNLMQRIDELQLPVAMEKEELKKLVRGFRVVLALKVPNPNEL